MTRAIMTSALLTVGVIGCGGDVSGGTPSHRPVQYIIGVDISPSRNALDLRDGRALLEGLVTRRVRSGDHLVLLEMYGIRGKLPRQWADSVPLPRNPDAPGPREREKLQDFRTIAAVVGQQFFDSVRTREIRETDIIGTLFRAADYGGSRRDEGGTILVLLSDMINSTPELSLERIAAIPRPEWVAARRAGGRLPDLRGVCVVVVGADVTSARGAALRTFWTEFLTASGASLGAYRNMIPTPDEVRC
jgi:hypothetical protein